MDARSLQELWSGPSPFLAQMGEQAFNQEQERKKADLAAIMGQEQRAQQMHPLEMISRETNNRLNASTAGLNEYSLKTKPDADTAKRAAMQKMVGEMDDSARAQMKAQVVRNMQLAAMMEKNGGQLPQGFNLSPEEKKIFQPKNLKNIIAHGQAFMEMDPEWVAQRQKAKETQALENTRAANRMELKSTPGAGGKQNPTMAPPKMSLDQQYGFYNNLAFAEQDPEKKKAYQAEADRIELMTLRKAILAQQARQAGDPNLADPKFDIPTNPMPTPQPTPRGGNALPNGVTKSGW